MSGYNCHLLGVLLMLLDVLLLRCQELLVLVLCEGKLVPRRRCRRGRSPVREEAECRCSSRLLTHVSGLLGL